MLPIDNRLDLKRVFPQLKREGKTFKSPFFIALYKKNAGNNLKIGFVVTKKVGKATIRQRLRRLLREAFRTNLDQFPVNFDIAIIARAALIDKKIDVLLAEVSKLAYTLKQ